ncbi:hypothetical protein F4861DRAFT_338868 [Xylaria intraflava]|nr:hypothetical protein F4861DRAFT_338868 [Xylaria intraflava]
MLPLQEPAVRSSRLVCCAVLAGLGHAQERKKREGNRDLKPRRSSAIPGRNCFNPSHARYFVISSCPKAINERKNQRRKRKGEEKRLNPENRKKYGRKKGGEMKIHESKDIPFIALPWKRHSEIQKKKSGKQVAIPLLNALLGRSVPCPKRRQTCQEDMYA